MILPGDVRELLNKVVEAERTAKANLIRRQEETAATRSLLNTARLMEDNPLLLRLKELEALEKLVEKVGRIDLHTGAGAGGFDALLQNLYRLRGRRRRRRQAVLTQRARCRDGLRTKEGPLSERMLPFYHESAVSIGWVAWRRHTLIFSSSTTRCTAGRGSMRSLWAV